MNPDERISKIAEALEAQDTEQPFAWFVAEAAQGRLPYSADFCYWRAMAEAVYRRGLEL